MELPIGEAEGAGKKKSFAKDPFPLTPSANWSVYQKLPVATRVDFILSIGSRSSLKSGASFDDDPFSIGPVEHVLDPREKERKYLLD